MNIAILLLDYTLTGGIERWVSITAELLHQSNCKVTIYSIFKSNNEEHFSTPDGIKIKYISSDKFEADYKLKTLYRIQNLSTGELDEYDFIITNNTIITLLLLMLKFKIRKKIISIEHSSIHSLKYVYSGLRRLLYPFLKYTVTQTKKSYDYLKKFSNCRVIPNPVTLFEDSTQWNIKNSQGESIKVLGVFRDHIDKQPSHYLKAHDYLSRAGVAFEFRTVGFEGLKGKKSYSNLTCYPPTRDIHEHYEWADVMLLLSKSEAFPMVMLEALSFGIPVIFYDHLDGPNDIIGEREYALKIKEHDFDELVTKVINLKSAAYFKQTQKQCIEIAKKFASDKILSRWVEILEEK